MTKIKPSDQMIQLASDYIDSSGIYFNTEQMREFVASFGEMCRKHQRLEIRKKASNLQADFESYAKFNNFTDQDIEYFTGAIEEVFLDV